jgi:heat shock protein 4
MDVDQKSSDAAPAAAEPVKKKKVRYTAIPFTVTPASGQPSSSTLADWVKLENKMAEETRLAVALANAKNAVEAYVYDARDKLSAEWLPFVNEKDATEFNALLSESEEWLYGEGEDQPREVYEKRLLSLKSLGDPIAARLHEEENRAHALSHFERHHSDYHAKATDSSDKYDHISPEDKAKVVAEINKNRGWLTPLLEKQKKAQQNEDPHFYARDLHLRVENLAKLADPIFNKPKPKPKPVETPKEEAKPAEESTPAAEPEQPAPAQEKPTEMEVD